MNDISYGFLLRKIAKNHKHLMSSVPALDAVQNINSEDRTAEQKTELNKILNERKPYEQLAQIYKNIRRLYPILR